MRIDKFIASRIFSFDKDNISAVVVRIAMLSVTLGVAVMLISVSVLIGFKHQIRDKVIGFAAHIQIVTFGNNHAIEESHFVADSALLAQLLATEGVKSVQKVAHKAGIIRTKDNIQAVVLKGVDKTYAWDYMQQSLIEGEIPDINLEATSNEVLISKFLANKLLLHAMDTLRMWFVGADGKQTRGRRFIVSGVYETGLVEFDERFIFGDLRHVQRLNGWQDSETGVIELMVNNISDINKIENSIYYSLPVQLASYSVYESYPHIFDWLGLQDMNVVIIIILMVFVSGITMISTLLIIILEKSRLIGLLKTMGAANVVIRRIFLIHSVRLLAKGMLLGNAIALIFILLQQQFGFLKLPADAYYLSQVPVSLAWIHFVLVNLGLIFLWLTSFIIPISVINKISPIKSIKFN